MKEIESRPKDIQITSPTKNDWEEVKNLRLEALQNDPQAFGSTYDSEAQRTDDQWKERLAWTMGDSATELLVLAKDGGRAVGMIGAFPKSEKVWNLKAMYVQPEYRGKGVSGKLVKEILREIDTKDGVEAVELMVNMAQEAAIRLYQKSGFEVVEIVKDQMLGDGKQYDEYVMRRLKRK